MYHKGYFGHLALIRNDQTLFKPNLEKKEGIFDDNGELQKKEELARVSENVDLQEQ